MRILKSFQKNKMNSLTKKNTAIKKCSSNLLPNLNKFEFTKFSDVLLFFKF